MRTYQDLIHAGTGEDSRMQFVYSAIQAHIGSAAVQTAKDAHLYASGKNATISKFQKLLYDLKGKAIPDNYTAQHKCKSGFFKRLVIQKTSVQLGNGVQFQNPETKDKLGKNIDTVTYWAVRSALEQGANYGFYNNGQVQFFKLTEFVPLLDEQTGRLMAGIRFWQLSQDRPLMAMLFEPDGYTVYMKKGQSQPEMVAKKSKYKVEVRASEADGEWTEEVGNYLIPDEVGRPREALPIVPLYVNADHQSELVGLREQIDCYDLIKSGFANDLDDASMLYWTITGAGGMEDLDLVKFKEHLKLLGVAAVGNKDDMSDDTPTIESHTVEVPYESREVYLDRLRNDFYEDAMLLDTKKLDAGNVTATQIDSAYEPLNECLDELEICLVDFFNGILALAGVEDDAPTFTRSKIVNVAEEIETVVAAGDLLPSDYKTQKILTYLGDGDRFDEIKKMLTAEEADRYKQMEEELEGMKKEEEGAEGEE